MHVSLFIPCFVDQLTPQVGLAVATVLERLGRLRTPPFKSVAATPDDIQLNVDPAGLTPELLQAALRDAVALASQLEALPAPGVSARERAAGGKGAWIRYAIFGGVAGCGVLVAVAALLMVLAATYGVL